MGGDLPALQVQYRMHPRIASFPVGAFYEGKVSNGENTRSDAYNKPWHSVR